MAVSKSQASAVTTAKAVSTAKAATKTATKLVKTTKPAKPAGPSLVISASQVALDMGAGNPSAHSPVDYAWALSERIPLETGILPPGVLSIRQGGKHLQMVLQRPPGIYPINWSYSESDGRAGRFEVFQMAFPYVIVVADFIEGAFLGARMFYSPTRISSLDQPLYHSNVPNTNCRGYSGNGVGWVCFYQVDDTTALDIGAKAHYVMERINQETYNDANMSETDGTRFYAANSRHKFLGSSKEWEAKSKKDGFAWTLDEKMWLPIQVTSADDQGRHIAGGVPLTLRMVMYGKGKFYYHDDNHPRLINDLAGGRGDNARILSEVFAAAHKKTMSGGRRIRPSDRPYSRSRRGSR